MKVLIPVDEKTIKGEVCQSFGRAPYFLIYDTETKEEMFIDNNAALSRGGAGIKAAQLVVDSKVDVLITPRCGQNAADVIQGAKINIFKTINNSIKESIDGFMQNKLEILGDIHPGFHDYGGK